MKNSSNASNCSLGAFKLATHQPRKLPTGEAAAPRRLGGHTPPRGGPPQPRDGELSAAGREAAKATAAPPLPVTRKPLNRRPSGERLACTTRTSARAWPALAPRFCASGICTPTATEHLPCARLATDPVVSKACTCSELYRCKAARGESSRRPDGGGGTAGAAAAERPRCFGWRAVARVSPSVPGRSSRTEYLSSLDPEKMRQCRLTMPVSSDIHARPLAHFGTWSVPARRSAHASLPISLPLPPS